jgi:hypothetical protein
MNTVVRLFIVPFTSTPDRCAARTAWSATVSSDIHANDGRTLASMFAFSWNSVRGPQIRGQRFEPIGAPRHQAEVQLVARQPARQRFADAARRPRDERDLPSHPRRRVSRRGGR